MTGFVDLPAEVINSICRHLRARFVERHPADTALTKKGLASLCRTSKALHQIALPHLYYHIKVQENGTDIVFLTKSILRNPQLPPLVHRLELREHYLPPPDPMLDEYWASHAPALLIGEQTNGRGAVIDDSPWHNTQWHTTYYPVVLLIQLHNLRSLVVTDVHEHFGQSCWYSIVKYHQAHPDFLRQLKEVTIDYECCIFSPFFDYVLWSPCSERIERLCLMRSYTSSRIDDCTFSSLLELSVVDSRLSYTSLCRLIKFCPKLENVQYECRVSIARRRCTGIFSPTELRLALSPLRSSLRTLILDEFPAGGFDREGSESLAEFEMLRNFKVGLNVRRNAINKEYAYMSAEQQREEMRNWDESKARIPFLKALPPSVKNLCISGLSKHYAIPHKNYIRSWMKGVSVELPNLKSLIIDARLDLQPNPMAADLHYQEIYPISGESRTTGSEKSWTQLLAAAGLEL